MLQSIAVVDRAKSTKVSFHQQAAVNEAAASFTGTVFAQVSSGAQQADGPAHDLKHASSSATQAFVMNDRAEQRFRQLEIKVSHGNSMCCALSEHFNQHPAQLWPQKGLMTVSA